MGLLMEDGVIFVTVLCDRKMLCPLFLLNVAVFLFLNAFGGEVVLCGDGRWSGPI